MGTRNKATKISKDGVLTTVKENAKNKEERFKAIVRGKTIVAEDEVQLAFRVCEEITDNDKGLE